jgi:hypothetical protein
MAVMAESCTLAARPWRSAFAAELRFPAAVRGPVLARALRRFAAILSAEVMTRSVI